MTHRGARTASGPATPVCRGSLLKLPLKLPNRLSKFQEQTPHSARLCWRETSPATLQTMSAHVQGPRKQPESCFALFIVRSAVRLLHGRLLPTGKARVPPATCSRAPELQVHLAEAAFTDPFKLEGKTASPSLCPLGPCQPRGRPKQERCPSSRGPHATSTASNSSRKPNVCKKQHIHN